jgi:threonine synthase
VKHISTRGQSPPLSFDEIVLSGVAPDGGLYVPEYIPALSAADLEIFRNKSYVDVAVSVLQRFAGQDTTLNLRAACQAAYATFHHPETTPLIQIAPNLWLMELFHGPTLAFKDLALQVLGHLIDQRLKATGRHLVIVVATSGDTGSAAIAALYGRERVHVVVLHPKGRVSEIQRRQMTTVRSPNVHNIALEGDFDAAQALVKALFADREFLSEIPLAAVNSINWARLAIQTVYYVVASLALSNKVPVSFAVPTGNFGDVFSGYVAKRMGAPVADLKICTNANDIVARAFETGRYERRTTVQTQSPSMDIQVASNFERLLFEASSRDAKLVSGLMREFSVSKAFAIPQHVYAAMRADFSAHSATEAQTAAAMARIFKATGKLIDPHTATALAAIPDFERVSTPTVVLATAHPAKFPDAVRLATGKIPELPDWASPTLSLPESFSVLTNDLAALKAYIRTQTRN